MDSSEEREAKRRGLIPVDKELVEEEARKKALEAE